MLDLGDLEEAPTGLEPLAQTLACDLLLSLDLGLAGLDVRLVRKVPVGVWALEIRRGVWHDWLRDLVVQPALMQDWLTPLAPQTVPEVDALGDAKLRLEATGKILN